MGFQNVVGRVVYDMLKGVPQLGEWAPWMRGFLGASEFGVAWDGAVRGRGTTGVGDLQGSPLSPVLFLV